jgi:hypothetical protein
MPPPIGVPQLGQLARSIAGSPCGFASSAGADARGALSGSGAGAPSFSLAAFKGLAGANAVWTDLASSTAGSSMGLTFSWPSAART